MRKKVFLLISVIFIFFISCFISAIVFLFTAKATLFDYDFYIRVVNDTKYTQKVYDNLNQTFTSLGIPGGIPDEVITNVVTHNDVRQEIYAQLQKKFTDNEYTIQSNTIYERFMSSFLNYAKEKKINVDQITKESLKNLSTECSNAYISAVSFPFINQISDASVYYGNYFLLFISILLVLSAVMVATVWILQRWKHRAVRYYMYSLLGSGIICTVFPAFLYFTKPYRNLMISPDYVRVFMISMVDNYLLMSILIGIFVMLLPTTLIPFYKRQYSISCRM